MAPPRRDILERLMERIRVDGNGCWIYVAGKNSNGYGVIYESGHNGKQRLTHRVTYVRLIGPIPSGLSLDHLCRVRSCCNPAHLEPVPHQVNVNRGNSPSMVSRRTGACVNGHSRNDENTYIDKLGKAHCRRCDRDRKREKRLKTLGINQVV
jgi:hypothetical protein